MNQNGCWTKHFESGPLWRPVFLNGEITISSFLKVFLRVSFENWSPMFAFFLLSLRQMIICKRCPNRFLSVIRIISAYLNVFLFPAYLKVLLQHKIWKSNIPWFRDCEIAYCLLLLRTCLWKTSIFGPMSTLRAFYWPEWKRHVLHFRETSI